MRPDAEVGPGQSIRFGVGSSDGVRSTTWTLFSKKRTTDVYLAARAIAGVQKVSFHQSGSWSHSFISDEKARPFVPPGESRHVEIWQRPAPFRHGWTRAYKIVVPSTELREDVEPEKKHVVWAPNPGPDHWVFIHVLFVDRAAPTLLNIAGEVRFLVNMTLVDESEVKVIAVRGNATQKGARSVAEARRRIMARAPAALAEIARDETANLRIGVYGNEDDGTRTWWDIAVQLPPAGQAVICAGLPTSTGLDDQPIRLET